MSIIEPAIPFEQPIEYSTSDYLEDKTILNFNNLVTVTSSANQIDMEFEAETDNGIELAVAEFVDEEATQLIDQFTVIDYSFYGTEVETAFGEVVRLPLSADFEFSIITEPFSDSITNASSLVLGSSYKISGMLNTQFGSGLFGAPFDNNSFGRMILEPLGVGYGIYIKRSPAPADSNNNEDHDVIAFENIVNL